jgi:hypothetical protein
MHPDLFASFKSTDIGDHASSQGGTVFARSPYTRISILRKTPTTMVVMPKIAGTISLGEKVNVVDDQHLNAIRFGGAQDRATASQDRMQQQKSMNQ